MGEYFLSIATEMLTGRCCFGLKAAFLFFCCCNTTQSAVGLNETDPSLLFVALLVDGKNFANALASATVGCFTLERMLSTFSLAGSFYKQTYNDIIIVITNTNNSHLIYTYCHKEFNVYKPQTTG